MTFRQRITWKSLKDPSVTRLCWANTTFSLREFWDHPSPESAIKLRIAEHRGHVDRDLQQEALHDRWIVEELRLQLGDTVSIFLIDALSDPALDRRVGVIAEIEPIAAKHGFQE